MIYIYNICHSYYLSSISHVNKYGVPQLDLSADEEATVASVSEHSFSFSQLCTERVIVKLFSHYKCDVVITNRLRSLFSSKLTRMGKLIQGQARQKTLQKMEGIKVDTRVERYEIVSQIQSRKRKPDTAIIQSSKKGVQSLKKKFIHLIIN